MEKKFRRLNHRKAGFFFLLFLLIFISFCSKPTDAPLKWRWATDIPVSNERFYLGDEINQLFIEDLDNMEIAGMGDSAGIDTTGYGMLMALGFSPDSAMDSLRKTNSYDADGDIVAFKIIDSTDNSFNRIEDSLEANTHWDSIGIITLGDLSYSTSIVSNAAAVTPLAAFAETISVNLSSDIAYLRFDPSSDAMGVTVENRSTGIDFNTPVTVGLETQTGWVYGTINGLVRQTSGIAQLPVAGRALGSTVRMSFSSIIGSGSTANPPDSLLMTMSFTGLSVDTATVKDSIIAFTDTIQYSYDITDSVNIEYIDINDGHFSYKVENHSDLQFSIDGEHFHVWDIRECLRKGIKNLATDLVYYTQDPVLKSVGGDIDSALYYYGSVTAGRQTIFPDTIQVFGNVNASRTRIFPYYDPVNDKSVTDVQYRLAIMPTGRMVSLSKHDQFIFRVTPSSFNFKDLYGTNQYDYVRTSGDDTTWVEVEWPWMESGKDSLRDKFFLDSVMAEIEVTMKMPDSAFLERYEMETTMFAKIGGITQPDTVMYIDTLENVGNDSVYIGRFPIKKLVNRFPDSIGMFIKATIKEDTKIRVINDGDPLSPQLGEMSIRAIADIKMNAFLEWHVNQRATLDLGAGKFEIDPDAVGMFRKMEDREISFNSRIIDSTNINIKLFAIMALDSVNIAHLDSMTSDEVYTFINNNSARIYNSTFLVDTSNFVNLFGPEGIEIPKRGDTITNSVVLNENTINKVVWAEKGMWRWMLQFQQQLTSDALSDTDFVYIQSWLHFEGINNFDSLLIWKNENE